tara:strand:- start:729 stop:1079 length:351 start_codon:yes stop_codon:yes gene_type:complete
MIITIDNIQEFSSLQIGDILYYQELSIITDESGETYHQTQGDPTLIGVVNNINNNNDIAVNNPQVVSLPANCHLFFVKPANKSNVKGYYMDVTMTNSKTERAEIFGVTTNIVESSK